jgi:4-diphosphocytidyl-2-C-methyl-D-erythritol kinase
MSEGVVALAPAKVNLSLRVAGRDASGMHPIHSLAQSIGWYDRVRLARSDEDHLDVVGSDALGAGDDNLVWRAIEAARAQTGDRTPVQARLEKRLPVAAGLGGGSSDAAAALLGFSELIGTRFDALGLAGDLGSDVAFCLSGGLQWMDGYGGELTPVTDPVDFWLCLVVPPFELSTPRVYRTWDDLSEPDGPELPERAIPPGLRGHGPFVNDLYPAARHINDELDDWRLDLEHRWDRPVAMSGSGPTLFGFFADADEGAEAVQVVPVSARAVKAAPAISKGASIEDR